jgi:2-dehydropantoate 2-reductase
MTKTNIAIIGLGGVGGYFGFKLASHYKGSDAVSINFVTRGDTFNFIDKNGLQLISPENIGNKVVKPSKLFNDLNSLNTMDYIFICVKEYDLEKLCRSLSKIVQPKTIIIPLMNGVDIYDRIKQILKGIVVLPACVYVASHISSIGVISHNGNPGKIIIGDDPAGDNLIPKYFLELLNSARIDVVYKSNPFSDIWSKFMFIASFGLVTANYNVSIGQVLNDKAHVNRTLLIMKEIETVAQKLDVGLPANIKELTLEKAATFPIDTPTSLQLDINRGKPNNELELFAGAIIKKGVLTHTPTIETKKIYDEISKRIKLFNNQID